MSSIFGFLFWILDLQSLWGCEMAHNTLKGMHWKERRGNYGGLIRLGTAVPLDFSKLNGDHDCFTTNPIMVIRDTKTVNVEEEEFMSAVAVVD